MWVFRKGRYYLSYTILGTLATMRKKADGVLALSMKNKVSLQASCDILKYATVFVKCKLDIFHDSQLKISSKNNFSSYLISMFFALMMI